MTTKNILAIVILWSESSVDRWTPFWRPYMGKSTMFCLMQDRRYCYVWMILIIPGVMTAFDARHNYSYYILKYVLISLKESHEPKFKVQQSDLPILPQLNTFSNLRIALADSKWWQSLKRATGGLLIIVQSSLPRPPISGLTKKWRYSETEHI